MARKNISREVEIAAGQNIKELEYWSEKLSGEPVKSCFPYDFKQPGSKQVEMGHKTFRLEGELDRKLKKLSKGSAYNLHVVLLAVLTALLYKYTGNDDILIGTPIYRQETNDEFINTMLVLRNQLLPDMTFREVLMQVKQTTADAVEHQAYPVELLPYKLDIPFSETGFDEDFPLFDVVLFLQDIHHKKYIRSITPSIIFSFRDGDQYVEGEVEYNSSRYLEETLARIVDHFTRLLQEALDNPDAKFCEVEILSEEEKKQLLFDFNDTYAKYPEDKTIRHLFEEQSVRTPDNIAIVGARRSRTEENGKTSSLQSHESTHLTYRELDREADTLARMLINRGVNSDTIVGIIVGRSIEMTAGILAILKAGGAYLPIDPDYPQERKGYILRDSGAKVLLTSRSLFEEGRKGRRAEARKNTINEVETIFLDDCWSESPYTTDTLDQERRGESMYSPAIAHSAKSKAQSKSYKVLRSAPCAMRSASLPDNLAYIIYTSGTTGKPKGVMIEHKNVVRLMFNDRFLFDFSHRDVWTLFHSYCFDFSVWEMYGALLYGGQLIIISKMEARDSRRYLEILKEKNVTILNQTPSSFYNLSDLELKEPGKELHIRYVIFGGEALNPLRLRGWKAKYPGTKLINMYGITETTVHVTFKEIGDIEIESSISNIGKPIPTLNTYVVDKYLNLVPIGSPGEMAVGGDGVGRGYVNSPGLTREKFIRNPYRPVESLYRSGDLVRITSGGEIEYLGRIDHQVKIRGFRVELGEIESQLLKHKDIKDAVVTVKKYGPSSLDSTGTDDKYICAYIVAEHSRKVEMRSPGTTGHSKELTGEFDDTPSSSDLRQYLSHLLPDYMIPSYFIHLENIPLTTNGKVDWKGLPEPGINRARVDFIKPRNESEEKLARAWSEVLGIEKRDIGIDDNFFELGGHSLKAAILVPKLLKEFNVKIALEEIFKTPTIRELAEYFKVVGAAEDGYVSIEPSEKKERYALSSAQERLYILQQMERENVSYNIPALFLLEGTLDKDKLEETFKKMISRHEMLRTSFEMKAGEPVQGIADPNDIPFEIEYYNAERTAHSIGQKELNKKSEEMGCASIIENFIRPFDLTLVPLFRVGLIELSAGIGGPYTPGFDPRNYKSQEGIRGGRYILMFDMHHIISDGISIGLFTSEFMALYAEEELPPLRLHYKDYSLWQHSEKVRESIKEQEEYWLEQYAGEIPVLHLPTDYPRPAVQSFAGSTVYFELGREEAAALARIAIEQGATLYMALLVVFNILLAKISGQEDIVIGTPIAGRMHADLERIIGMFVNTLALRNFPVGDKTFNEFAAEVKERTLKSFENQEYQFEGLVDKAAVSRDTGRNPVFDVMFVFQNIEVQSGDIPGINIPGLSLKSYAYENKISKFDINFTGVEAGEKLHFAVEYCTKLFKKGTIKRFIDYTRRIISAVTRNPGLKLYEIEILSEEEKQAILYEFNKTRAEYPRDKSIWQLFKEQVLKTPDSIAVTAQNQGAANSEFKKNGTISLLQPGHLSYRQLNREASRLAIILVDRGIKPEIISGIMVELSIEMIVGILAILKAGGAYMPIDPGYPEARKQYMLQDSNALFLLTTRTLVKEFEKLRSLEVETVFVEDIGIRQEALGSMEKQCRGESMYSPAIAQSAKRKAQSESFQELRYAPCAMRSASSPDNLAYIMYTSGSTGKPKGVMVVHRNVVRLVKNTNYVELNKETRILQTGAPVFDATTFEIWGVLLNGGFLYLVDREVILDAHKLAEALLMNKINTLWLSSPLFNQLIQQNSEMFSGLKYLLVGGDVLSPKFISMVRNRNSGLRVINGYGPTENTTFSTTYLIDKDFQKNIPIGKPINNSTAYILGKYNNVQPVGTAGELCVGGDGVSRGYLNNPELTAEKFNHSVLLYKTGDLALWQPDGSIAFIRRIDQQVKIRGFRIELGEIESRLLEVKGIKEAVVLGWEKEPGQRSLCAYIVSDEEVKVPVIKEYLSAELPVYMIPACFMQIEKIPLNPNGKLDRKSLPAPEVKVDSDYVTPESDNEKVIAGIWMEVLGLDKVGIHNNFFDLGGNSLDFIKINNELKQVFKRDFPLVMMFRYPTIGTFARYLDQEKYSRIIDRSAEKKQGFNRMEKMRNRKIRGNAAK